MIYAIIFAHIYPEQAPAMPSKEIINFRNKGFSKEIIESFLLPLLLVILVLEPLLEELLPQQKRQELEQWV